MAIKFLNTATAATQAVGDNSTKIATTAYADAAASAIPIGNYLPLSAGASKPLTGGLHIPHYIYHAGDTGTHIGYPSVGRFTIATGTATRVDVTNAGFSLGDYQTNVSVSIILDEDNMASDSATALVTQQSIKAYVDAQTPGAGVFLPLAGGTLTGPLIGTSATFSNTVTATGGFLVPYAAATKKPMINLVGATNYGLWHTEGSDDIFSFDFGGVSKQQFFQSGNATFAGDLTVSGGDITLGGTGRIQGVDTVSASTDATNKAYVDNAVAGVPQGDITAVVAGNYLTGGGTSGSVTLNGDNTKLAHIVDSSNGSVTSGWITVAQASGSRKAGEIYVTDGESSDHSFIRIDWMRSYADTNFTVLNCGGHANRITGVRVLQETADVTYGKKYLQIQVTATSNYYVIVTAPGTIPNYGDLIAETPVLENTKTGYAVTGAQLEDLQNSSVGTHEGITVGEELYVNGTGDSYFLGNVGMGTTTADQKLHIKGGDIQTQDTTGLNGVLRIRSTITGTPSTGGYPNVGAGDAVIEGGGTTQRKPGVITLMNGDSSISSGQDLGVIQFVGKDDSSNGYCTSQIISTTSGTMGSGASGGGILRFLTSSGNTGAAVEERMRINNSGRVMIGTTTSASNANLTVKESLSIQSGSNTVLSISTGYGSSFINTGSSGGTVRFGAPTSYTTNVYVQGTIEAVSSVQMGNNTAAASAANAGSTRYRVSGNNSYMDMSMRTGATTYAWVNIVQNNW